MSLESDWVRFLECLERWYRFQDQTAGHEAFSFLEGECRRWIRSHGEKGASWDVLEDDIASFLQDWLRDGALDEITNPKAFFRQSFRNHCIDRLRSRQRGFGKAVRSVSVELADETAADVFETLSAAEQAERVLLALGEFGIEDRVAVKLCDAPERLTESELGWIAARRGCEVEEIRGQLREASSSDDLSLLLELRSDDLEGAEARSRRIDRFRKRVSRARARLRDALEAGR